MSAESNPTPQTIREHLEAIRDRCLCQKCVADNAHRNRLDAVAALAILPQIEERLTFILDRTVGEDFSAADDALSLLRREPLGLGIGSEFDPDVQAAPDPDAPTSREPCPACDGSGRLIVNDPADPETCERCSGRGDVPTSREPHFKSAHLHAEWENPSLVVACAVCGSPVGHYCNDTRGNPKDGPHEWRKIAAQASREPRHDERHQP